MYVYNNTTPLPTLVYLIIPKFILVVNFIDHKWVCVHSNSGVTCKLKYWEVQIIMYCIWWIMRHGSADSNGKNHTIFDVKCYVKLDYLVIILLIFLQCKQLTNMYMFTILLLREILIEYV